MSERIERFGDSVIVYDDALVGQVSESLFAADTDVVMKPTANAFAGRGAVDILEVEGRSCVLRHYFRGGMVRSVAGDSDSYIWAGEDRTRSFSEWRLLAELHRRALPVPRPVAGRYVRSGWRYTADLITERLLDVQSVAALMTAQRISDDCWNRIGATIAQFHHERINHADLNAHNIQIRDQDVYLLDFDRGRIMPNTGAWATRNLQRLQRSLDKISRAGPAHFTDSDWAALMAGYENGH